MKKTADLKDLRAKDTKSLMRDLGEAQEKIVKLQFDGKFRKLKNFHEITYQRKLAARLWTVIGEKARENFQKINSKEGKNA